MCGGGGGSPKAPDPMLQAQADMATAKNQFTLDRKASKWGARNDAKIKGEERDLWEADLLANRINTRSGIDQQFADAGLTQEDYGEMITASLDRAQGGISFGSAGTFAADTGTNLLDDILKSTVRDYQGQINEFAPEGFESTAFASTADDDIIAAILAEQFGTAQSGIQRAFDRGTLNQSGFDSAMLDLGNQNTAANAELQGIGGGILETNRGYLGDIAGNARTAAGNYNFGDTFDASLYSDSIATRTGELTGSLEGDIRNAIGGQQFFNTNSLINKGGVSQGAQNPGGVAGGSLLAAVKSNNEDADKSRGLGTQGSF